MSRNNIRRFSREMQLVMACARTSENSARIAAMLKEDLDWARVVRMARKHHLASLVYWNLNRVRAGSVPEEAMAELRKESKYIASRNLFLVCELLTLLKRLEREGIKAIPFKGPMLAAGVYRNMGLRCCGDLDLLIEEEDAVAVKRMLVASGMRPIFPTSTAEEAAYLVSLNEPEEREYFRTHWEYHLLRADYLNIDLHWRIMPPELGLNFDHEALWRRATRLKLGGQDVPNLSPEDLLLVLCANGTKDCWYRLDRVCDITELLRREPRMDWAYIMQSAREMGGMRLLLLGLALAKELMDAPLPTEAQRALARDSTVRSLASAACTRLALEQEDLEYIPKRQEILFHLRVRERAADRARYCVTYMSPSVGDWAMVQLPRRLSFLYFVLRPLRLLGKFGGAGVGASGVR